MVSTPGHLGEFLGGAIAAKFIKGTENINAYDVASVSRSAGATEKLSAEFETAGADKVEFINVVTNPKNVADLTDTDALISVMGDELEGPQNLQILLVK